MKWGIFNGLGAAVLGAMVVVALAGPWIPGDFAAHERWVSTAFGLGLYVAFGLGVSLVSAAFLGRRAPFFHRWAGSLQWLTRWHGYVGALVAVGGGVGALLFLAVGGLLRGMPAPELRLLYGLRDGAMYVGIWAPALAFIRCVMLAYGQRQAREGLATSD